MFNLSIFKQLVQIFKAKFLLFIQIIVAFLLPIHILIGIIFMFIFLDTVSGTARVYIKKEGFTSRKLASVISKILLYNTALISVYIIEKFLLFEFVTLFSSIPLLLTKICAVFFSAVECISINENITKATGFNMFTTFKQILFRVKNVKDDINDIGPNRRVS